MELYHALNRGTDKRDIVMDDADRIRFVYGLFVFNDTTPVDIASLKSKGLTMSFFDEQQPRNQIVDIHGWCLMTNHFHLLLSERVEGGMTLFLKKFNIGYAKYFNDRHQRSGTLYQGRTKRVLIDVDAHFLHILNYIHLNPLDFLSGAQEWRGCGVLDSRSALAHLSAYRWSSYLDYCGQNNFPGITTKELFGDMYGDYKKSIDKYLREIEVGGVQEFLLE